MTRLSRPHLETLDVDQFGEPGTGAAYLLRGERTALVDAGTARNAPRLSAALHRTRLDWILITHAHLDHAGGAGILAADHPEATVVAHPRALPHLTDPTRLEEGVRAASPDLSPLYGSPTAIPEARLRACADGETLDLGRGVVVDAVYSPGHAPHHVCWFERGGRVLFAGDAVGHHNVPVDLPLTVPPRFDLEKGLATLAVLRALEPQTIAFAHFGLADRAAARLTEYATTLERWLERVATLRSRMTNPEVVECILSESPYGAMSFVSRHVARLCIAGALASLPIEAP
ncbi:MAG: MBL fold metallo-hydrolase [Candidatus Bipolaricaulota bacterium]|nr:MBL fold metallo-hydrolase [Candidatus Bipolaricaulota bacterium]